MQSRHRRYLISKPTETLNPTYSSTPIKTLNPTHLQLRLAKTETLFRTATPSPGGYQPWPAPLNQPAHHEAPPAAPGRLPEVIILSCGDMNPFDFQLSKANHRELYNSGQLSVHLHAVRWGVYHPTTNDRERLLALDAGAYQSALQSPSSSELTTYIRAI